MAKRRIPIEDGKAAVAAMQRGSEVQDTSPSRDEIATAVRYLLEELTERAPGNSVEVRVPPFGVTQCVQGPRHTRGTPPNVIETDPETWVALATGSLSWDAAVVAARVEASGSRATLEGLLPLVHNRSGEG